MGTIYLGDVKLSPDIYESVTYSDLVDLRDNSELIPGCWYRITDYECTTTQDNTQSAGNQFDILVQATDVNVLNENARAIKHSGDTYFSASTLDAWELKYCLDNDTDRFMWADDADGKGVIYYMKDEFGNECPYDFKNIQFKRWLGSDVTATTAVTSDVVDAMSGIFVDHYHSYQSSNLSLFNNNLTVVVDSSDSKFFYTFSLCSADGESFESDDSEEVFDGSLKGYGDNMYTNNVIGEYIPFDDGYAYKLNNIVFKPIDDNADDCGNNVFGKNCYDMTLGFSWTVNNSFGNECYYNSFGNSCGYNSFGNECNYNSFGNGCNNNSFGNGCESNSFGNDCNYNSFGNGCYNNSFGNECYNNSFGNYCNRNSFGNNNYRNSFGNSCGSNSFGNGCNYNSFGNECQYIHFLKEYTWYIIVENGNKYIDITSTQSTSSSSKLRNFTITQGVNTDGTSSTKKTISHDTVNDIFKTTYQPTNSQVVNV